MGDIHATREADTVTTRDRGGRPERVPRTSRYRTPCVLSRPVWRSGLRSAERDLRDYLAEEAAGTPTVRYQQSITRWDPTPGPGDQRQSPEGVEVARRAPGDMGGGVIPAYRWAVGAPGPLRRSISQR